MHLVSMQTLPLGMLREFFQALHLRWATKILLQTKYFKIWMALVSTQKFIQWSNQGISIDAEFIPFFRRVRKIAKSVY
jgi:hypothetical protein